MLPQFKGRLNYIRQPNKGLPAARNTAIRDARGKYLALLDADDIWRERRLELTVAALDANPEVGIAHGRVVRIDANGRPAGNAPTSPPDCLAGRIATQIYTRRSHILCPSVAFRRECVDKVGFFDESLRATEDRDMWFRIAEHYSVAWIPEVIAEYRSSPSSMSRDLNRMVTAQLQFCRKHRGRRAVPEWAWREALASIYREQGDAMFSCGMLGPSIRNYWRAVVHRPASFANIYMLLRAFAEPALALTGRNRTTASAG